MILDIYKKHFNKLPKSNADDSILFAEEYHAYAKNVERECFTLHTKSDTEKRKDVVIITVKDIKLIGKDRLGSCTDIMHILGYDLFMYSKPYDIIDRGNRIIFKCKEI